MTTTPLSPTVVPNGQGRVVRAFGDEAIFHLESSHTGGMLTMWTNITPPGGGPPPHYHANEEEWWVVQEGRVSFLVNGNWQEVPPGGIVFAPRNSVHTFKNIGDTPSRVLVTTSPAGFENFFSRCAAEFNRPGGPSMERILAISAEHGIHYVNP
jgi:quercetin dioxygenase-like cupin family protein